MGFISRKILPFAIILAMVIVSAGAAGTLNKTIPAQVVSITDGDTIIVRVQDHKEKVRLIGIDAPECRPNPKAEKDSLRTGADMRTITAMGQKATMYVKSVIRPGDMVQSNWTSRNGIVTAASWPTSGFKKGGF
jgi:micrococcal nuclease